MKNTLTNCKVTITVDLIALKKQKATLLSYIDASDNEDYSEMIEGLLALIDGIQDNAVKENGFEEDKVFTFIKE